MATFLNVLLLLTVLALTKFSALSAELNELSNKKSAIKVTRSVMPGNFLESGPEARDKKIGDQRNWEDRLNMKRNWDELSSWGKRSGFDNNAVDNEFGSSLKRALKTQNLKRSSLLDGAELEKRWDSLQAWGKRNLNNKDNNADDDSNCGWHCLEAAYNKKVKRDDYEKLSDGSWGGDRSKHGKGWDAMNAWGEKVKRDDYEKLSDGRWNAWGENVKRDDYEKLSDGSWNALGENVKRDDYEKLSDGRWGGDKVKRANGWDAMNAWGKRSAIEHRIKSRNWDSLQAWGKRESPSDDSPLYEKKQVIGQLQKRSTGKIL